MGFLFASADALLDSLADALEARDAGLRQVALAMADAMSVQAFGAVGLRSGRSWLRAYSRTLAGDAGETESVADLLVRFPHVRAELEAQRLSYAAAVTLARSVTPPRRVLFERDQVVLLSDGAELSQPAFERLVAHWAALADQEIDGSLDAGPANRLFLQYRLDGGTDLWGTLDAPTADVVCRALDAFDSGPDRVHGPDTPRPLSARRADALGDMASHALATIDDHDRLAPRSRTTNLTVDLPTLAGRTAEDPDLRSIVADLGGATLSAWAVERLLCDSRIAALVTDASGAVIDATETTAEFTPTQRRLIAARDRGCAHPGCGAPVSWCDIHHLRSRAEGGGRALDNGVLLCRRHHRLVHQGWSLERDDGGWVAVRPDGVRIAARPPP